MNSLFAMKAHTQFIYTGINRKSRYLNLIGGKELPK
jgi:hypothetical protein